jgi:hypothetical protein
MIDKMPLNKISEDYVRNDGQINYFGLDFRAKKLDIELLIRKHMVKQIFEPCKVMLTYRIRLTLYWKN